MWPIVNCYVPIVVKSKLANLQLKYYKLKKLPTANSKTAN